VNISPSGAAAPILAGIYLPNNEKPLGITRSQRFGKKFLASRHRKSAESVRAGTTRQAKRRRLKNSTDREPVYRKARVLRGIRVKWTQAGFIIGGEVVSKEKAPTWRIPLQRKRGGIIWRRKTFLDSGKGVFSSVSKQGRGVKDLARKQQFKPTGAKGRRLLGKGHSGNMGGRRNPTGLTGGKKKVADEGGKLKNNGHAGARPRQSASS